MPSYASLCSRTSHKRIIMHHTQTYLSICLFPIIVSVCCELSHAKLVYKMLINNQIYIPYIYMAMHIDIRQI